MNENEYIDELIEENKMNPECFVCGKPLTNKHDIVELCHVECQVAYDIQESLRESDSGVNRYPWEQ